MLITAIVVTPVFTLAQGAAAPATDVHHYPLPTYEEDWRPLYQVDRTDIWDPVKFVPLSADGTTSLSFGGEARLTYERFAHQNFGLTPPDPDGYLLQRYLLHTDLHVGSRVRVWSEFNSGIENGRIGGPRPEIDEDRLDLHQVFVDVTSACCRRPRSSFASAARRSSSARDACTRSGRDRRSPSASTACGRLCTPAAGASTAGRRGR
jgi:hypothetical protein